MKRATTTTAVGLVLLASAAPTALARPAPMMRRLRQDNGVCDAHTIMSGDTLYDIATQASTDMDTIKQLTATSGGKCNVPADWNNLQLGDCVCLPSCNSYTINMGESLYNIAIAHGTTTDAIVDDTNIHNTSGCCQ